MTAPDALRLVAYTAVYVGDDILRDLERIRAAANRRNPADGISGALLFDRGRFIQAVEGPPAAIEALLTRVRSDACAGEMDVLFDCVARARSLQDWTLRVSHLGESPCWKALTWPPSGTPTCATFDRTRTASSRWFARCSKPTRKPRREIRARPSRPLRGCLRSNRRPRGSHEVRPFHRQVP